MEFFVQIISIQNSRVVLLAEDELINELGYIVQLVVEEEDFDERNEDEHQELYCQWLKLSTC